MMFSRHVILGPCVWLVLIGLQQTSENTPCPQGYHQTFQNLQGSSNANSYMGLYTLKTYDVYKCQQLCDAVDQCTAFNIYYERDPSVNPADSCPNPPSFTNIKCTLWGSNVTPESAVNKGQYRKNFHVVITGSNGTMALDLRKYLDWPKKKKQDVQRTTPQTHIPVSTAPVNSAVQSTLLSPPKVKTLILA